MTDAPEGWSQEMWNQFKDFMGGVTWLSMAGEIYAEENNISIEVANHYIASDWSVKQAKSYVKSHQGES